MHAEHRVILGGIEQACEPLAAGSTRSGGPVSHPARPGQQPVRRRRNFSHTSPIL
jgi:hypothetical protein